MSIFYIRIKRLRKLLSLTFNGYVQFKIMFDIDSKGERNYFSPSVTRGFSARAYIRINRKIIVRGYLRTLLDSLTFKLHCQDSKSFLTSCNF